MILRRVAKSIRARDWFSFSIEFAIVVAGVFIGIQVANWNYHLRQLFGHQEAAERFVRIPEGGIQP